MTFTVNINNLSDNVQEGTKGMEDEVQSVEITSMNVLQTDTIFITFPLRERERERERERTVYEALSPKAEEQHLLKQKGKLEEELTALLNAKYKLTACERMCSSVFQCQMQVMVR